MNKDLWEATFEGARDMERLAKDGDKAALIYVKIRCEFCRAQVGCRCHGCSLHVPGDTPDGRLGCCYRCGHWCCDECPTALRGCPRCRPYMQLPRKCNRTEPTPCAWQPGSPGFDGRADSARLEGKEGLESRPVVPEKGYRRRLLWASRHIFRVAFYTFVLYAIMDGLIMIIGWIASLFN